MVVKRLSLGILSLLCFGGFSAAHDLWLVPRQGATLRHSEVVEILAQTGLELNESEYALDPRRIAAANVVRVSGVQPLTNLTAIENDLVIPVELGEEGETVVTVAVKPEFFYRHGEAYNLYLTEPGVPTFVLEYRRSHGLLSTSGREIYSKYAKLIIGSSNRGNRDGNTDTTLSIQPTGLRYEIILMKAPSSSGVGDVLPVKVVFDGQALPGATVHVLRPDKKKSAHGYTTGDDGVCKVPIDEAGLWSLSSIHMRPYGNRVKADWESFFTTTTFVLP